MMSLRVGFRESAIEDEVDKVDESLFVQWDGEYLPISLLAFDI